MRFSILFYLAAALAFVGPTGCGDNTAPHSDGGDLDGTTDGDDGSDGADDGGDLNGADGADDGGDQIVDPCAGVDCPADQHCEDDGSGLGVCTNNSCDDLDCSATEECQSTPGGGAICVDISCSGDIDCPLEQNCDGSVCIDDICQPGFEHCQDQMVETCNANGSAFEQKFTCGSPAYFESQCQDDGQGNAFCTCDDDWDCPPFATCEVGVCIGTGRAPTCRLEPEPFTNVLPTSEISWGGDADDPSAQGSPFSAAAQVVMTPLVANLDDDNGDGLINENDIPEIIFLSFRNHEYTENGILRAIHGGGPNKGSDFFAVCGDATWHEGDDLDMPCTFGDAVLDSTASPAVGDLNNDGVPEIVAIGEGDKIAIYSNMGDLISLSGNHSLGGGNPAVSLANVDNQGLVEIVVGRSLFTLQEDDQGTIMLLDRFEGDQTHGKNGQGPVSCVANLLGDSRQEIVAGTVAYRWPMGPAGMLSQAECTGSETDPDEMAWCAGQLLVAWDANDTNINPDGVPTREGLCSVADVLGADRSAAPGPDNPLDQQPEVITIADGRLLVMDGATGQLHRNINLPGSRGGAPNVDDFDGDGYPEMGTAFATSYVLIDFQDPSPACPDWPNVMDAEPSPGSNPDRTGTGTACSSDSDCLAGESVCNQKVGTCVCLHNAWQRQTEDDSSRVTGSSVFDFNGDGGAEVVYNDECQFRIYNGLDGNILFEEPSESRTRIEYPVVADVDNDGNAEIVFGTSNESGFCSENQDALYNAGIEVWGDSGDFWVSARRVWNQHSYHVTNVQEDGRIPLFEPENYNTYNGRSYNAYRSNPRNYNTAPDLTPLAMQFSSPDASCGQLSSLLDIVVQVMNAGDLIVGPSLVVRFEGTWTNPAVTEHLLAADGSELQYVLQNPLAPGASIFVNVSYDAANNPQGTLPDLIRAVVDAEERERECDELNNFISQAVEAGEQAADLRLELGPANIAACPDPTLEATLFNDGSLPATDVLVRFYAGDPDQGGSVLTDHLVAGTLQPGESVEFTAVLESFPGLMITVYGVADPTHQIFECNDGNNKAEGPQVYCFPD